LSVGLQRGQKNISLASNRETPYSEAPLSAPLSIGFRKNELSFFSPQEGYSSNLTVFRKV